MSTMLCDAYYASINYRYLSLVHRITRVYSDCLKLEGVERIERRGFQPTYRRQEESLRVVSYNIISEYLCLFLHFSASLPWLTETKWLVALRSGYRWMHHGSARPANMQVHHARVLKKYSENIILFNARASSRLPKHLRKRIQLEDLVRPDENIEKKSMRAMNPVRKDIRSFDNDSENILLLGFKFIFV
jgi:hypothetical protein